MSKKRKNTPYRPQIDFWGGVKNSEKNFVENEISYTFAKY